MKVLEIGYTNGRVFRQNHGTPELRSATLFEIARILEDGGAVLSYAQFDGIRATRRVANGKGRQSYDVVTQDGPLGRLKVVVFVETPTLSEVHRRLPYGFQTYVRSLRPQKQAVGTLSMVREFHEVSSHPVHEDVNVKDEELNSLRLALLREEWQELKAALIKAEGAERMVVLENLKKLGVADATVDETRRQIAEKAEAEVLDALCDLQYVLDGTFLALGFHKVKDAAMTEIHRSNMSKLGEDGRPVKRDDGKILKGPNYSPPDLIGVLARHRKQTA